MALTLPLPAPEADALARGLAEVCFLPSSYTERQEAQAWPSKISTSYRACIHRAMGLGEGQTAEAQRARSKVFRARLHSSIHCAIWRGMM
eukprot:6214357-Pleurochrysis_carterae.AAC.9